MLEEVAAALLRPLVFTHWLVTLLKMSPCHHEAISDPWPICSLVPSPEYHLPVCHPCISGGEGAVPAGPSPSNTTSGTGVHTKDPSPAPLRQKKELDTHQRPPQAQGLAAWVPRGGRGGHRGEQSLFGELCGLRLCLSISPATRGGRS